MQSCERFLSLPSPVSVLQPLVIADFSRALSTAVFKPQRAEARWLPKTKIRNAGKGGFAQARHLPCPLVRAAGPRHPQGWETGSVKATGVRRNGGGDAFRSQLGLRASSRTSALAAGVRGRRWPAGFCDRTAPWSHPAAESCPHSPALPGDTDQLREKGLWSSSGYGHI